MCGTGKTGGLTAAQIQRLCQEIKNIYGHTAASYAASQKFKATCPLEMAGRTSWRMAVVSEVMGDHPPWLFQQWSSMTTGWWLGVPPNHLGKLQTSMSTVSQSNGLLKVCFCIVLPKLGTSYDIAALGCWTGHSDSYKFGLQRYLLPEEQCSKPLLAH